MQVMNNFLPSAVKFHYQFNLREMSNMTQGLCRMMRDYHRTPLVVSERVVGVVGGGEGLIVQGGHGVQVHQQAGPVPHDEGEPQDAPGGE